MTQRAILSVYDKTSLAQFAQGLDRLGYELVASGGTARCLRDAGLSVTDVAAVTGSPEMLGGRVKTLHPAIHGGILARDIESDRADLAANGIRMIDLVVCNLYPFAETAAQPDVTLAEAVEQIDIGGVALLRAAAKNFARVTVVCDPADYDEVLAALQAGELDQQQRQQLAVKAFAHTRDYDTAITAYLQKMKQELTLRYGMNPHQTPARVYVNRGALPITVLNGSPGFINLLDALNSWQLVRALKQSLGLPAAASFKHVSPAGAAVSVPLTDTLKQAYFVGDKTLSPLATAYARARGADRISSFGDWIALSDTADVPTAQLIRPEVSDGVIAPDYEPEALAILKSKKGGGYRVLQIDPDYEPEDLETRQVFGLNLEQRRNTAVSTTADLTNVVTANKSLPDDAKRDMVVALLTLKYTQSNSVCYAYDGQIIGNGAGQQSRIHCTRLAGTKADTWFLRQHPRVLDLPFKGGIGRPVRDNAIDQFLLEQLTPAEEAMWQTNFTAVPARLSPDEKREWLDQVSGVTLGSDAFFPFRDSIDRAQQSGVGYVVQPGGSIRDDDVVAACDEYGMVMVLTGTRLFHH